MGMQHVIPLPFNSIFPSEEPAELIEYLKRIDKKFLKRAVAFSQRLKKVLLRLEYLELKCQYLRFSPHHLPTL